VVASGAWSTTLRCSPEWSTAVSGYSVGPKTTPPIAGGPPVEAAISRACQVRFETDQISLSHPAAGRFGATSSPRWWGPVSVTVVPLPARRSQPAAHVQQEQAPRQPAGSGQRNMDQESSPRL